MKASKKRQEYVLRLLYFLLIMVIILSSEGYATSFLTFGKEAQNEAEAAEKESIYLSTKARYGLEFIIVGFKDLGSQIQTTPVHPDDSSFLTGQTTTNLDESDWGFGLTAGLVGSIGNDDLRLKIGADIRLNLFRKDDYREGIYDVKQQVSDTRPASSGSFVFTQVIPDYFTYIPFAGVEKVLSESLLLSFEFGLPYMKWEVRSGHDRWGKWQTVQEDSWSGFGRRYTGTIAFKRDGKNVWFISGFYERYRPEFAEGKADATCFGGLIGVRF